MPSSVPHHPTFAYLLDVKASFKADVKHKGFETIYGRRGVLRFPPEKTCRPTLIAYPPALAAHPPNSKLVSQISVFCSRTRGQDWVSMRFLSRHGFCVPAPINERLAAQRRPPRGSGRPRTGMTEHTVKSLRFGARQEGLFPAWSSGQPDLPTLKTLLIIIHLPY